MQRLQIAMMKRYATDGNLEKIICIAPNAKITLFNIQKLHTWVSRFRGGLGRILPFTVGKFISNRLDQLSQLSDNQKLIWIDYPSNCQDKRTALLFPPNVESNVSKELISRLEPCWIHSIMTGVDRLPPISTSTLVTSSQSIHSVRIAEFVMSYIFAIAKNLPKHIDQNKKRIWKAHSSQMIMGARIGIVGLGSIGIEVAKIAKKCGMEVWAIKRKAISLDFVDQLLTSEELPDLLRKVDYVVLAVPLTRETRNLIGKAEFDMMKSSACLINICRGAVVDEDALFYALKNESIRAACIDVFQNEKPLPRYSRFYKLPNILVTSWSGWKSADSIDQQMNLFFKNLKMFIEGKQLLSVVDKSQLRYR